jgi:hypothetical protein
MLVIVTRPGDGAPAALARAWPGRAVVATPRDLSTPGWRFDTDRPQAAQLVANGEVVPLREVAAIITRLGWVLPEDLPWIEAEDRPFVAAEMSAFLLALLASPAAPTLNPPSAQCLAGPLLQAPAWRVAAGAVGFAPAPPAALAARTVSVVRGVVADASTPAEAAAAASLAEAQGAGFLAIALTRTGAFVDAHPFLDLTRPDLARLALSGLKPACAA